MSGFKTRNEPNFKPKKKRKTSCSTDFIMGITVIPVPIARLSLLLRAPRERWDRLLVSSNLLALITLGRSTSLLSSPHRPDLQEIYSP